MDIKNGAPDQDDPWRNLTEDQRSAIEEGLMQAERGEFATDEEVEEVYARFRRWTANNVSRGMTSLRKFCSD